MASSIAVVVVFLLLLGVVSAASTPENRGGPFKKIFAFGDSFTDTGNTKSGNGPAGFGHVSASPYGITYFHRPTNRYSDGRLVIDFVTESLNLPFLPPYRTTRGGSNGANFAVAGSTAINHAFFVKNNMSLAMTPESIQTQLLWFNKHLETLGCEERVLNSSRSCRRMLDDSLFWVGEIGVNDYAYNIGSTVPDETIRKLAVSSLTQVLRALLTKGAKYMVVQGPPPTGCLTLAMSMAAENDRDSFGCVKSVNNQTYTHSLFVQSELQKLRRKFPEATIVFADYWNAYRTVVQNAERYGFTDKFSACCGTGGEPYNFMVFQTCGTPTATVCENPKSHINWDGVHLTEAMYKALADMFLAGNYTQPSFASLLSNKQS